MATMYEKEALAAQVAGLFTELKSYVLQAVGHEELHIVERPVFRRLQLLGHALLEGFISATGTGWGDELTPQTERRVDPVFDPPYLIIKIL